MLFERSAQSEITELDPYSVHLDSPDETRDLGENEPPRSAIAPLELASCRSLALPLTPPRALECALHLLEMAYDDRYDGSPPADTAPREGAGCTFQAVLDLEGAPPAVGEIMADTTWGTANDRWAMTLTHAHGLAALKVKTLRGIMGSSAEAEGVASSKAGEMAQELAEIKRATGAPVEGPIVIGSDSLTEKCGSS